MSRSLAGVFVPVATPFQPATESLDEAALRSSLERLILAPIRGVLIAGTTGESVFLTGDERKVLLEVARAVLPADRLLLAGAGAESTREAIRLTVEAAKAGADFALVEAPAFYRRAMTSELLAEHWREVAEASPIPVILYIVPSSCGSVEIPEGLVSELSTHPNIVGIKDSRGDLTALRALIGGAAPGFQVLIGNGAKLLPALEMGAVGGILGVANLAPAEAAGIHRSFAAGRRTEAARLQERIAPLHDEIVNGLGVPGVKAALDLLGSGGGAPRRPLRPAGPASVAHIQKVLREAGFLDTPRGAA